MSIRSAYDFDPERDLELLPVLISTCEGVETGNSGQTITLRLVSDIPLTVQDIGRLIIVHGKCRSRGKELTLRCSETVYTQLTKCWLDRIVWTERIG